MKHLKLVGWGGCDLFHNIFILNSVNRV